MAAQSVVNSWSFHHGLYAAIEPRIALRFAFDAERHRIGKQMLRIRNESGSDHITYKVRDCVEGGGGALMVYFV